MAPMKRKTSDISPAKPAGKGPKGAAPAAERTSYGLKAVGLFSGKVTRPLLGKRGLAEGDLIARWELIVGPAVARLCVPERITFKRGERVNGTLVIRVGSGPAATVLQHDMPRIVERINGHFGYAAVKTLKIVQAPLPLRKTTERPAPRPLTPAEEQDLDGLLAGVTDPDLRATLERLGRSIRGRTPGR